MARQGDGKGSFSREVTPGSGRWSLVPRTSLGVPCGTRSRADGLRGEGAGIMRADLAEGMWPSWPLGHPMLQLGGL